MEKPKYSLTFQRFLKEYNYKKCPKCGVFYWRHFDVSQTCDKCRGLLIEAMDDEYAAELRRMMDKVENK